MEPVLLHDAGVVVLEAWNVFVLQLPQSEPKQLEGISQFALLLVGRLEGQGGLVRDGL